MLRSSVLFSSSCLAFSLLLLSGCGGGDGVDRGPLGSVEGQVTFESAPVAEGTVQFSNAEKGYAGTGQINSEGHYVVKSEMGGLPVGLYKVSVVPPTITIEAGPMTPASEGPKDMPNIPVKYRAADTSGLTVEIKEGENTFNIEMQGK